MAQHGACIPLPNGPTTLAAPRPAPDRLAELPVAPDGPHIPEDLGPCLALPAMRARTRHPPPPPPTKCGDLAPWTPPPPHRTKPRQAAKMAPACRSVSARPSRRLAPECLQVLARVAGEAATIGTICDPLASRLSTHADCVRVRAAKHSSPPYPPETP